MSLAASAPFKNSVVFILVLKFRLNAASVSSAFSAGTISPLRFSSALRSYFETQLSHTLVFLPVGLRIVSGSAPFRSDSSVSSLRPCQNMAVIFGSNKLPQDSKLSAFPSASNWFRTSAKSPLPAASLAVPNIACRSL